MLGVLISCSKDELFHGSYSRILSFTYDQEIKRIKEPCVLDFTPQEKGLLRSY